MKTYSNIFNYIPESMVCAAIINLTYEIIPVDENVFQINFHHQASEIVQPGAHIKIYSRKHNSGAEFSLLYDTGPFYTGNQTVQMDMNFKYDFRLQLTNNGECPEIPIDDCPGFDNIGISDLLPTQSFWYQGIWSAGDTVHDPEVNCYVDYIDENGVVQHFIIGPEENGCQEILASSILDTFGVTTCNPNPTTVILCQRSTTGTTAGNVCSVMINTNCKVEMQNVSFIQTGDRVLNSNSTPFNGLNKYWLIRQSIAAVDDPAYPCLVDNNGYVTVSFLCG